MIQAEGAKKVLILLGSPRQHGNSAILAGHIAQGAVSAGAEVETIYLHGMEISACQSCYACQKQDSKGCAIDDEMQSLYPKLLECGTWVFAGPVYWFTVSAQTKLFLDRCFALPAYGREPFRGKRIAVALTYGDADPFISGCVNALRTFQDIFRYVGAEIVGMVYGSALDAGDIERDVPLLESARKLGEKLVSP